MNHPKDTNESIPNDSDSIDQGDHSIRSLKDLIERVSGKSYTPEPQQSIDGFANIVPFPFLAVVGQNEMKLALLLSVINPAMGGVLLIGPRGTGKSTAVRGLIDLLPEVPHSLCFYGCMPEDIEAGGIDAVCEDCARKYAMDEPLTELDRVRLIDLPLNARLDDVIGAYEDKGVNKIRGTFRKGILVQADKNLLFIDEINLLSDDVVDVILDASAQGYFLVRRGSISAVFHSRFVLIGSMNPEEGYLRPQMMDRFGLRVIVRGLSKSPERLEAYIRSSSYKKNSRALEAEFSNDTKVAFQEIQIARDLLPQVTIPSSVSGIGLGLIKTLGIASLRAEITLFEAAKAHAVADGRLEVSPGDIRVVAPLALRLRRSEFIKDFLTNQEIEENELLEIVDQLTIDN